MKKLVLVALTALLAMSASGCIITSGDDDPNDTFATITAKWSIKNIASNNNNLPCPPGTTTTALYNQVIDDNGNLVGQPAIDLFDCDDFQGAATDLDPDIYQTWIELTTDNGASVTAESLSAIVDVIDVDKTFETTILEDGGYFMASWTLRDAAGGGVLSCAQALANNVSLDVTVSASPNDPPVPVDLPCEGGFGVSQGFRMGTYQISITATDAEGPLGEAIVRSNVPIGDWNAVTDLGAIDIPID
ncbi:MAG: hypothetical protein ACKV2T_07595 [Kofleriaceae bacterium]